ncbi:hypothetical protein BGLA2_1580007 [Burkholderia gladioli]|nr:hypothetical protein BGLA2_1580007 [Burkholderia gladioli]
MKACQPSRTARRDSGYRLCADGEKMMRSFPE